MKWILSFFIVWLPSLLWSQGTLEKVSVDIKFQDATILVRQQFTMNMPDSIQTIRLKALEFEGNTFLGEVVANGIRPIIVEKEEKKGLDQLKLTSASGFKEIMLSYKLEVVKGTFYVPLFFTELAATSSDIDFFQMKMQMSEQLDYAIYFPGVPVQEQIEKGIKAVRFTVPALPSLVRMELFSEKKEAGFLDNVDMIVALLFVGIALLIWKYRKRLAYG